MQNKSIIIFIYQLLAVFMERNDRKKLDTVCNNSLILKVVGKSAD